MPEGGTNISLIHKQYFSVSQVSTEDGRRQSLTNTKRISNTFFRKDVNLEIISFNVHICMVFSFAFVLQEMLVDLNKHSLYLLHQGIAEDRHLRSS